MHIFFFFLSKTSSWRSKFSSLTLGSGLIGYETRRKEWWSDTRGDGCSDCAIFSRLLLLLLPSLLACLHACVRLFFLALLCNAVSDLEKNMCQRAGGGGQLSECMTTSTSVSSLTAQLAARALAIQLGFFLPPSSLRMYGLQVRCKAGRTGDLVPLKITFST